MRAPALLGAVALATALGACGGGSNPQHLADTTARGLYANDAGQATQDFDDGLKGQVTRAQVGALSDLMHRYGDFKGLKQSSSTPDQGRYEYEADFAKGTMLVQMRLDPSGKIGAYRITAVQ